MSHFERHFEGAKTDNLRGQKRLLLGAVVCCQKCLLLGVVVCCCVLLCVREVRRSPCSCVV